MVQRKDSDLGPVAFSLRHGALLAYTTENSSLCQLAYGITFVKRERSPDILQMTKILLFLR